MVIGKTARQITLLLIFALALCVAVVPSAFADEPNAAGGTDTAPAASEDGEDASAAAAAEDDAAATTAEYVNMYRLYNPNSGEHFYTSSLYEAVSVCEAGWRYEGVGWVAPESSGTPVYRLYNPNAGDHHYTTSAYERDYLVSVGWSDEGIGWYSDDAQGVAVLRQYNPNAVAGAHNFTTSSVEDGSLVDAGWSAEGIAWYAASRPTQTIQGRWIVTSAWGSLERYWLDSTATIAKDRLVDPTSLLDSGAGWYAYAKSDGAVVRGKWDNGAGRVYVADGDGRLASTDSGETDWLVTDEYDGGYQRYYMDMDAHAACSGFFEVKGYGKVYGLGGEGYVMRGKSAWGDYVMVADNEGKLYDSAGWYVGTAYDSEIQRYYFELVPGIGNFYGAKTGEFTVDGNLYCGRSDQGYVYRNSLYSSGSSIYRADNDGVLTYVSSIQITQDFRSVFYHGTKTTEYQKYIVLHDTEGNGSASSVIDWWAGNGNYIAAHFVINKDGSIVQCVPLDVIAHHAGYGDTGHNAYYGVYEDGRDDLVGKKTASSGTSDYGMNSYSIGIELVHVGGSGYYPEAQLEALDNLIAYIDAYYGFESQIIDHKMWRTGNSDTSSEFAGYLANYIDHRTHD